MSLKSFASQLTSWYNKNKRDLPWRLTKDPYKIWISEIMLQQTTVNAAIPYYQRWIKSFPSIKHVAKAPAEVILKSWQGLGYYSRARNIHRSAQIMCAKHGACVPENVEDLRKLPGFGPYTVGAVLSIAYDQRQPIIDANVRRVFMRLMAIVDEAHPKYDDKILERLQALMPKKGNDVFNQALMELGALICKPKDPACLLCPIKEHCCAYMQGSQDFIPTPKKKIIKELDVVIALIMHRGKYFIQKRPAQGLLADLWEFPGGKIEEGETKEEALIRELKEELNCDVLNVKHRMDVLQFYTTFKVNLHVYECQLKSYPRTDDTHQWVGLNDLSQYPMPSGTVKIIRKLQAPLIKTAKK